MSKELADSMMESMEETFKEIESREDEPEEEDPEPEKPEPEKEEEPEEETPEKEEKAPVEAKVPEKPAKAETPAAPVITDKSLINPPNTWTAKGKSLWGSLPEDVRKEVRKREDDAIKGITQYKEMAKHGERFTKAASAYDAFFRSKNIDPFRAVEDAFNLSYSLSTSTPQEKRVILDRIAAQYGAAPASTQATNPEQDKFLQVLQPVLNEVKELKQSWLSNQQTERQRQTTSVQTQIESFAGETDETGKLKHPYFENVKDEMAYLLESGKAAQLSEAYAKACDRDPEIRVLMKATQPESAKREEKGRVDKAKRNDSLKLRKSPPSPAATGAPKRSMRETVEATYESLQNA